MLFAPHFMHFIHFRKFVHNGKKIRSTAELIDAAQVIAEHQQLQKSQGDCLSNVAPPQPPVSMDAHSNVNYDFYLWNHYEQITHHLCI